MGKYMRKAKITGEIAVMEIPHQSSLGVRTRARTLALQRLQNPSSSPSSDSSCYIQLRSRRLEKPLVAVPNSGCRENPNSPSIPITRSKGGSSPNNTSSLRSCSKKSCREEDEGGVEVSFGENVLETESRHRNVRETTPCSLMRDLETTATPGSTTRPTNSTTGNGRMQTVTLRSIPTTREMEEFFAGAEQLQQRIFKDKYNYDPVNDCPLPGRYEWERLDS